MIGIWHAMVAMGSASSKFVFLIENSEGYKLTMHTEPSPVFVAPMDAAVEGQKLIAVGKSAYFSDPVKVELIFEEEGFSGCVTMPFVGAIRLEGARGRGESLAAELIASVAPYRKSGVEPRAEGEIREAVEQLLGRMSLEDKIGQMSQILASSFSFGGEVTQEPPEQMVARGRAGSILGAFDSKRVFELQRIAVEQSPHGIPLLFNADVIHGFQTIFPVPLAWSCSWDMEAIREACAIAAKEATASGITYNHAPMVDISRDPRWGRVVEGAGEDPYLGALIARAQVEGFQGDSLSDPETILACLKHFIGYGAAEGGRDYNTVDISEGTMRNVYLPPFIAGIEAGAGSVMNAFNIYQGVPVAGSSYLLKDVLREELGFDGILISDYGAIDEIRIHGAARDRVDAARLALGATMDIEMVTDLYQQHLPELIRQGMVDEAQLDAAVRRILTYKHRLGLMDDPYRYIRPEHEIAYHFSDGHLASSRELARKSIVLLKNDGLLPLRNNGQTVALIGPFANSRDLLGPWQFSRYGMETVTLLEGLAAKGFGADHLLVASGCEVDSEIPGGFERALEAARQADIVILALGEDSNMSGEAASRTNLSLPTVQQRLAEAIVTLGKPTALVLTNGRPLVLDWFEEHVEAIVETWFLGSQAGHAIADVLVGDYNPSGRLTMSFPQHAGQVPNYYNAFRTGRPMTPENQASKFISKYLDAPNEPLYPFGYGLGYTSFAYSGFALDRDAISADETLTVSVEVANTGEVSGEETVQLYLCDLYGSVVRPVKELKGFRKLWLEPGESRKVSFEVTEADLRFYTPSGGYRSEPGAFHVMVGPNARDVQTLAFALI